MLKVLKFFTKSVLVAVGLLLGLQIQASSDVPTRRVIGWPQRSVAMVARPRLIQPTPAPGAPFPPSQLEYLKAREQELKNKARTAGYGSAEQKELRETQKAIKQAEKEEKAAQKRARQARKQAEINRNIEKSKENERFRLAEQEAQRAAIDDEIRERREQRAYAALQADPKFRAQRIALSRQNELFRQAQEKAQRAAIDQEIRERQQARAERAAQLEKDRAEQEAWEDRYEKDLAAELRDRALFTGRKFATPEPKTRQDKMFPEMLAQQEQNLVVSQATDMLRTLNQKEAEARKAIAENSGMFSNLFASRSEKLRRNMRVAQAKEDLHRILTLKEEVDTALGESSVKNQLAELEYVQERIDNEPATFSPQRLQEERERTAILGAQMLAETREKKTAKKQGQESRYGAFGEYGEGAQPAELNLLESMAPGEGQSMPVRVQAPTQVGQERRGADAEQEQENIIAEQRAQRARERSAQEFGRALEEARELKAVRRQGQVSRSEAAFGEYGRGAEQPEFAPIPEPTVGSEQPVAAMEPFVAPEESEGEEYKQAHEEKRAQEAADPEELKVEIEQEESAQSKTAPKSSTVLADFLKDQKELEDRAQATEY